MNATFFERGMDIIPLANQADANTDVTGDYVKMLHYQRAGLLLAKYGSEDVDDLSLQLLQATSAAGSTNKALAIPGGRAWYKTGTLASQATWTNCGLASSSTVDGFAFGVNVPTDHTRAVPSVTTNPLLLYVEFELGDMDHEGGYHWWTCFIEGDNVNNACLVSAWAILMDARFKGPIPLTAIS